MNKKPVKNKHIKNKPVKNKTEKKALPESFDQVIDKKLDILDLKASVIYYAVRIIVLAAAFIVIFTCFFGVGNVSGNSMYPRLYDRDLAVYYRRDRQYEVGDIITFCIDEKRYFSRIVAMEGDTVDIISDGVLVVNGIAKQEDDIYYPTYKAKARIILPAVIEDECVFVLGDYRTGAVDSREFGSIPLEDVDGRVIASFHRGGM